MTSVRLTPAQERVLRAAGRGEVFDTFAPNRRGRTYGLNVGHPTLHALRTRGLVVPDPNEMGKRVRHFRPSPAGRQWLADHPEES